MDTTLITRSDPNADSFSYGMRRGRRTWWVLVAGEGPGEELAKGLTTTSLFTREGGRERTRGEREAREKK